MNPDTSKIARTQPPWKRTIENREHHAISINPNNRGTAPNERNNTTERSEARTNKTATDQTKSQGIR